ncbi:MAG: Rv3654c family TadE-like protein [Acidimicrobiia bacterium]
MRPGPEAGSAMVALCALAVLTSVLGLGLGRLAAGAVSRARAETAADAAALAAATELAAGRTGGVAERSAKEMAGANGARLVGCDCRPGSGSVRVVVAMPRLSFFFQEVRAVARAELHTECPG